MRSCSSATSNSSAEREGSSSPGSNASLLGGWSCSQISTSRMRAMLLACAEQLRVQAAVTEPVTEQHVGSQQLAGDLERIPLAIGRANLATHAAHRDDRTLLRIAGVHARVELHEAWYQPPQFLRHALERGIPVERHGVFRDEFGKLDPSLA